MYCSYHSAMPQTKRLENANTQVVALKVACRDHVKNADVDARNARSHSANVACIDAGHVAVETPALMKNEHLHLRARLAGTQKDQGH